MLANKPETMNAYLRVPNTGIRIGSIFCFLIVFLRIMQSACRPVLIKLPIIHHLVY